MSAVLDELDGGRDLRSAGYFGSRALADLIPHPTPKASDPDIDGRIRSAAAGWPNAEELAAEMARWIPRAAGSAECADALVSMLRNESLAVQASTGMAWVAALMEGNFERIAGRSWLVVEWLEEVSKSGSLDAEGSKSFRHIIDGLAAAGDARALRLQQTAEN